MDSGKLTRFRPGLIKPVSRVGSCLAGLLGYSLIVGADLLEKSIASAGLGYRNIVLVGERLELRI